jgi:hypothetical protein
MDKIEFYKNRTLSERFSASVDFLKQNWKALYKNILIGAIPLSIIGGYFMPYYQQISFGRFSSGNEIPDLPLIALCFVVSIALMIYLNAMTGAVLIKYGKRELDSSTGWSDLSGSMFSLSGKTFLINLILGFIVTVVVVIIALIIAIFASGITSGSGLPYVGIIIVFVVFILLGFLLAFGPFIALSQYPAYFSGAGIWESIKIAFGMGFRNWGNVMVTLLLTGIVFYIINIIFALPNTILVLFSFGETGILTFLFGFIAILGSVLTYPVLFIFIAFQYFSIVESEQGISLQAKVDEFANL